MRKPGGYDAFFESSYPRLVRGLTFALGDQTVAEDCAQEAFAKAFVRWREVSTYDRPDSWTYVVALRVGRRQIRRHIADEPAIEQNGGFEGGVIASQDMTARLASLTARQRTVIVLRYYADLTTPEIAAALGLAEGTVRAVLHQSLQKLRLTQLNEEEVECL